MLSHRTLLSLANYQSYQVQCFVLRFPYCHSAITSVFNDSFGIMQGVEYFCLRVYVFEQFRKHINHAMLRLTSPIFVHFLHIYTVLLTLGINHSFFVKYYLPYPAILIFLS